MSKTNQPTSRLSRRSALGLAAGSAAVLFATSQPASAQPNSRRKCHAAYSAMGQDIPEERQGRAPQGDLQEPLRHHAGRRSLSAEAARRQRAGRRSPSAGRSARSRNSRPGSTRRPWPSAATSRSPSIHRTRAKAAASRATSPRPTSTPRTSAPRSTSSGCSRRSIVNASALIGICGFGGMALNAAAVDKRVKAVVTTSMYDMSRVMAQRLLRQAHAPRSATKMLDEISRQRWADAREGHSGAGCRESCPMTLDGSDRSGDPDVSSTITGRRAASTSARPSRTAPGRDQPAVVHEHAAADLHRGDFAAADPAHRGRRRRIRATSAEDAYKAATEPKELMIIPRRRSRRSLRSAGQDPVRQDHRLLPAVICGRWASPGGRKGARAGRRLMRAIPPVAWTE